MSKTTVQKPPEPEVVAKARACLSAADARLTRLIKRRGVLNAATGRAGSKEWPRCFNCGETDVRCLEDHHYAGRSDDQSQVIVCSNCHCKLSDGQYDNPPWSNDNTVSRRFHGLADLLRLAAENLEPSREQSNQP